MTRQVHTCRPEDTLARAAQILVEKDCGCIPVVDRHSKVVGITTDRDILRAVYAHGKVLPEISVGQVMRRNVHCCAPDDTITAAEAVMIAHRIRRVPVVDESGRLAGLLALDDIALEAARERGQESREVSDAEVGETLAGVCRRQ
jgi:CBS domain-containing protein